jgi:PAS domain S-box-containing protein
MNNLSVLIAGTSSSYLEISKKMLKFHYSNCEVDLAYSGQDCIDKALSRRYDIVLFDYDLGDMNGLQVIDKIRARDSRTPLIILVEEGRDDIADMAMEQGASDFVLKVRGYLTALPITIRNIVERSIIKTEAAAIPQAESAARKIASAGYFILDRRGKILSANRSMEEITNYTQGELMELSLPDLLPKEQEKSFYDWFNAVSSNGNSTKSFRTEILGKRGAKSPIDIRLTAIKDENQNIVSFRGQLEKISTSARDLAPGNRVDQLHMISRVAQILAASYWEPFNVVLESIAECCGRIFRFQRVTLALLDRRKNAYVKHAMIGYANLPSKEVANLEVPQEVIDRIFANKFLVKVLYYNQAQQENALELNSEFYERRTQKRRPNNQWHKRDLVLVNLLTSAGKTFGYISLDLPVDDFIPGRDTFKNLELFGKLAALIIENYYQFSTIEKRSRRLKQILVTSNIFKLHLSLDELLKEMVWSIKFSLDFNLVALGLISKRSSCLELKAVACDDRVKQNQLSELKFQLTNFANLFRGEYLRGKSYFIVKQEEILHPLKQIYHNGSLAKPTNGGWPSWGVILVPLKSRDGKVIGVLLVDDPEDQRLPTKEVFSTLEILANQVAVAVDNRVLYIQAKKQLQEYQNNPAPPQVELPDYSTSGIKRLLQRLFN